MNKKPTIINITGKPEGSEDSHELQSIYPIDELMKALGIYLARSLKDHVPIKTVYLQKIINKKAAKLMS